MSGCILSLDYGTTCLKGVLYDSNFNQLAVESYNFTYEYPAPNCIEYAPEGYLTAAREVSRSLLSQTGIASVDVLALTGQAETIVLLDKENRPLGNAIVWLDTRAGEEAKRLEETIGLKNYYSRTGIPAIEPAAPLCKLPWLAAHEPERYAKIGKVLMLKDYVAWALTGVMAAEPSVSSCTGYLNIGKRAWDDTLLAAAGIDKDLLPPLVEPCAFLGTLRPEEAEKMGLSGAVQVSCGMIDQSASAVGCGNFGGSVISETTGTVLAVAAILEAFQPEKSTMCVFCHGLPGEYMALPNCYTAGVLLKWYRDSFHGQLSDSLKAKGENFFAHVDQVLMTRGVGNKKLIAIPHFCGSQAPVQNADATGVLYGLTLDTDRYDVAAALMEGVGFLLRENLEDLKRNGLDADTVYSLGGGANSPWWLQVKADITGKRICTLNASESTALGAAYGAGIALGRIDKAEILRKRTIASVYEPGERRAFYEDKYQQYLELNRRLGFYPGKEQI